MKRFKNILCVAEPDESSKAAVIHAVSLAKANNAQLSVVCTVKRPDSFIPLIHKQEELEKTLAEVIDAKTKALKSFLQPYVKDLNVTITVHTGIKFIEVIRDVLRNKRDLVIKCCDTDSWIERLFGSDDMHLLRKCPCPVLMLTPEQTKPFSNLLATVDVTENNFDEKDDSRVQSQLNKLVLEHSSTLAASAAELHIGSVWDAYGEDFIRYGAFSHMTDKEVDDYVEQTRQGYTALLDTLLRDLIKAMSKEEAAAFRPVVHLVKGQPTREIPQLVKQHNIDLIIMGTVARTGIPGFIIGNTAEIILEQVQCSVLAIKPDGFLSPITL
ncbi:MAG: universal stress protein [Hahellaceae bacterium]|nr:universal stress protein [Hahellaceae bacterium]MCP5213072.1 universal stress protein [Hahellaceae bacterium]